MQSLHSRAYKDFAKLLKLARVEAEFTQAQVAAALGVTQSFVSDCERRERRVDLFELLAFARLYRKRVQDLLPDEVRKEFQAWV